MRPAPLTCHEISRHGRLILLDLQTFDLQSGRATQIWHDLQFAGRGMAGRIRVLEDMVWDSTIGKVAEG
jgi:hypothetical protein